MEMQFEYNEIIKYRQTTNLLVLYSQLWAVIECFTSEYVHVRWLIRNLTFWVKLAYDALNRMKNVASCMIQWVSLIIDALLLPTMQVDETVECPAYMERAEDGMEIILARLISILDSWISFEDNVMMEMDAAESASQRIMEGSVGEVALVTDTSEAVLSGMIETTGEASDMAHRIVENVLGQFREDDLFGPFPDGSDEDEEYWFSDFLCW